MSYIIEYGGYIETNMETINSSLKGFRVHLILTNSSLTKRTYVFKLKLKETAKIINQLRKSTYRMLYQALKLVLLQSFTFHDSKNS